MHERGRDCFFFSGAVFKGQTFRISTKAIGAYGAAIVQSRMIFE